jgi:hypothetical protein
MHSQSGGQARQAGRWGLTVDGRGVLCLVVVCQDPNIETYAAGMEGQVFVTDAVLSHLMTCRLSVRGHGH